MITVSKDRQISIWDTAMFMCFTTLKKETHEMGMIFNQVEFDLQSGTIFAADKTLELFAIKEEGSTYNDESQ